MTSAEQPFDTLSQDQRLLVGAVQQEKVRVIVIGGYAVRVHGYLRAAEDLDLLVDPTEENLIGLQRAVTSAGPTWKADRIIDHLKSRNKLKWNDVEFFAVMNDVTFDAANQTAVCVPLYYSSLLVISKAHLIEAKYIAAAANDRGEKAQQDTRDLQALGATCNRVLEREGLGDDTVQPGT